MNAQQTVAHRRAQRRRWNVFTPQRTGRRSVNANVPGDSWWVNKDRAAFMAEVARRDQIRADEHAKIGAWAHGLHQR